VSCFCFYYKTIVGAAADARCVFAGVARALCPAGRGLRPLYCIALRAIDFEWGYAPQTPIHFFLRGQKKATKKKAA